jgi:hypothetical protein
MSKATEVTIEGLSDIRQVLDPKRIDKAVALAFNATMFTLHDDIKRTLRARYEVTDNQIEAVRAGKTHSDIKSGTNVLERGLSYNYKYRGLGSFQDGWFFGNINSGKRFQGTVFRVKVSKKNPKIAYGRTGRGGFIPMSQRGALKRNKFGGFNMYERTSDKRYPLKILFAPAISQMIGYITTNEFMEKHANNLQKYLGDLLDVRK